MSTLRRTTYCGGGGATTNILHNIRAKHPAEEELNFKSKTDNQTATTSCIFSEEGKYCTS